MEKSWMILSCDLFWDMAFNQHRLGWNMKIPKLLCRVSRAVTISTCKQNLIVRFKWKEGDAILASRLSSPGCTSPPGVRPLSGGLPRQRDCHYDHYRWPFSLCPPSKGLLVLPVAWLPSSSPLARWLLTPGLAHSLAPAPSISLITAMKAVQTETGIRAN